MSKWDKLKAKYEGHHTQHPEFEFSEVWVEGDKIQKKLEAIQKLVDKRAELMTSAYSNPSGVFYAVRTSLLLGALDE